MNASKFITIICIWAIIVWVFRIDISEDFNCDEKVEGICNKPNSTLNIKNKISINKNTLNKFKTQKEVYTINNTINKFNKFNERIITPVSKTVKINNNMANNSGTLTERYENIKLPTINMNVKQKKSETMLDKK